MATRSTSPFQLLVASCAIALAIVLGACGGSDGGSDNSKSAKSSGSNAAATTSGAETATREPKTDEGQIRALVQRARAGFASGDGNAICDSLTSDGQQDIVKFGNATGLRGRQCPDVARAVVERERDSGTKQSPIRVLSVRVRGSQAVGLVRPAGAPTLRQRYVKEDGEWRIESFNLAAAVGV